MQFPVRWRRHSKFVDLLTYRLGSTIKQAPLLQRMGEGGEMFSRFARWDATDTQDEFRSLIPSMVSGSGGLNIGSPILIPDHPV